MLINEIFCKIWMIICEEFKFLKLDVKFVCVKINVVE